MALKPPAARASDPTRIAVIESDRRGRPRAWVDAFPTLYPNVVVHHCPSREVLAQYRPGDLDAVLITGTGEADLTTASWAVASGFSVALDQPLLASVARISELCQLAKAAGVFVSLLAPHGVALASAVGLRAAAQHLPVKACHVSLHLADDGPIQTDRELEELAVSALAPVLTLLPDPRWIGTGRVDDSEEPDDESPVTSVRAELFYRDPGLWSTVYVERGVHGLRQDVLDCQLALNGATLELVWTLGADTRPEATLDVGWEATSLTAGLPVLDSERECFAQTAKALVAGVRRREPMSDERVAHLIAMAAVAAGLLNGPDESVELHHSS